MDSPAKCLKMRRLALQEFSVAEFTDELAVAGHDAASHDDDAWPAFDQPALRMRNWLDLATTVNGQLKGGC